MGDSKRKRFFHKWQPEELEIIDRWGGEKTLEEIVRKIQALDKRMGWPIRTDKAVRSRVEAICKSVKSFEVFSVNDIARYLEIHHTIVGRWVRFHGLSAHKNGHKRLAITRKDFKAWAYQNERLLYGKSRDGLFCLTDDADFADRVSKGYPNDGTKYAFQRLDTKDVFRGAAAASKFTCFSTSTLRRYARQGVKEFESGGVRWRVL